MDTTSSVFSAFRAEGYPVLYSDLTSIRLDVVTFRLVAAFLSILLALLLIVPGFRGRRITFLVRWMPTLLIAFLLLACNFLPYWETGQLDITSQYRAGSGLKMNGTLAVYIGLRGLNVTLVGLPGPVQSNGDLIDYNEHFSWAWLQGKPGFGYDAGPLHKAYRHAQHRGLPYPILWVAETFTIDYGQVRIGRYYRQAGWFAHVFLWLAVPLFFLANVLFQMVIQFGSLFMFFTGASLLMANLLVSCLHSSIPFSLAFEGLGSGQSEQLTLHYSWCYYGNLFNGILCITLGLISFIADLRCPDETADFFGNDVLQSYEDYFAADPLEKCGGCTNGASNGGQAQQGQQGQGQQQQQQQMPSTSTSASKSDNEVLLRKRTGTAGGGGSSPFEVEAGNSPQPPEIASGLKKRVPLMSNRFSNRFQKSTIRKVIPSSQAIELRNKGTTGAPGAGGNEGPDSSHQSTTIYENYQQQFDTIGEETEL